MPDEKTVQRFIELRASGWTYARLTAELNVCKNTLSPGVANTSSRFKTSRPSNSKF
jgi:orotate phosphoribosyltransferase-like protein